MVQGLNVDADEVVGWRLVVKPELMAGEGVAMLDRVEVEGVEPEVELRRCTVTVTLLQDLQHIRWKSGREQ